MRALAFVILLSVPSLAQAKKPPRAAALAAAKQFVAELIPADDPQKTLGLEVSTREFTFVVGNDDGFCSGTISGNPDLAEWARGCLARNDIDSTPDDGQWFDWSAKEMKTWSWQIDESEIPKMAKHARMFALKEPETWWVLAVVQDDDGKLRVAGAWSGMTYDAE